MRNPRGCKNLWKHVPTRIQDVTNKNQADDPIADSGSTVDIGSKTKFWDSSATYVLRKQSRSNSLFGDNYGLPSSGEDSTSFRDHYARISCTCARRMRRSSPIRNLCTLVIQIKATMHLELDSFLPVKDLKYACHSPTLIWDHSGTLRFSESLSP